MQLKLGYLEDNRSFDIPASAITDAFLKENGFSEFAVRLKSDVAGTLKTILHQADERNNIVAEMLAR